MKLTDKLTLIIIFAIIISSVAIGMINYQEMTNLLNERSKEHISFQTETKLNAIKVKVEILKRDLEFLEGTPPLQGIIRSFNNKGIDPLDGSTYEIWRKRLAVIFEKMLISKPNYLSIRYIGKKDNGKEIVRVHRFGDKVLKIDDAKLQKKGDRLFFKSSITLPPGKAYISKINLNREFGKISIPHTPVLRISLPIYHSGDQIFGILIINLKFDYITQEMLKSMDSRFTPYLINETGSYLYHPDTKKTFGFDLGKDYRIQDNYKNKLEGFLKNSTKEKYSFDYISQLEGKRVNIKKYFFDTSNPSRFLAIVYEVSKKDISAEIFSIQKKNLIWIFFITLVSGIIGYFLSIRMTKPLKRITHAVDDFSKGVENVEFDEEKNDAIEIKILNNTFKKMTNRIKDWKKALETSEMRHRLIIDTSLNGIVSINSKGIIELFNPAASLMFGYTSEEIKGRNVSLLVPPPFDKEHDGYLKRYHDTGIKHIIGGIRELEAIKKNGDKFFVEISIVELETDGELIFISSLKDINDEKLAKDKLLNSKKDLEQIVQERTKDLLYAKEVAEQANMARADFLAKVSHEVKTPLNSILGFSSRLELGDLNEDQLDNVKCISSSTESLLRLMNELLDLSKAEAGKIEIILEDFNLTQFLREIHSLYSHQAEDKKLEFFYEIEASCPLEINGDRNRIYQIITNLLNNAFRFTHHGYIKMHVDYIEEKSHVLFTIEDSGVGIPEGDKERIFKSFTQKVDQDHNKYGGAGLGLTIVKELLNLMGSDIEIENNPDGGSIFSFFINISKSNSKEVIGEKIISGKNISKSETSNIKDKEELLTILNGPLKEEWNEVSEKMVISKIEQFSQKICELAEKHGFIDLLKWGKRLKKEASDYNSARVEKLLADYPSFWKIK